IALSSEVRQMVAGVSSYRRTRPWLTFRSNCEPDDGRLRRWRAPGLIGGVLRGVWVWWFRIGNLSRGLTRQRPRRSQTVRPHMHLWSGLVAQIGAAALSAD